MTKANVLFLCTGNTCRSPMAEIMLNAFGSDRYAAWSEKSKAPESSGVIAELTVKVLRNHGVHTPERNQAPKPDSFQRIIAIGSGNRQRAERRGLVVTDTWEIADPFRGDENDYEETYEELKSYFAKDLDVTVA